jgi:hypothetical protein
MSLILLLLIIAAAAVVVVSLGRRRREEAFEERRRHDLDAARVVADEDVTQYGEQLQRLDSELADATLDEATRQDYQRALDSYEAAKDTMTRLREPDDVRHVSERLEDGRYAVACVRARVAGEPLPTRRPPCFFNPGHGPSTTDIEWAPPGGRPRSIPVCAADADRVSQGAEPDVRTVPAGFGRVPYWQGGPAYSPWAGGYFGGYAAAGLVPGILLGSLMASSWDDGFGDGLGGFGDYGYVDGPGDSAADAADGADSGDGGDADGSGGDFGDFGGGDSDDFGGDSGGF